MTNIAYVQPIFAPDERRAERNINSLATMGAYIKQYGTNGFPLTMVIGGWAKTDALWEKMLAACKEHIAPDFVPIRFDRNYGKAMVVNKLMKVTQDHGTKVDYMLMADSDILFPIDSPNMFGRLVIASQQCETNKKKPFGMVALNQKGEGCHYKSCYENSFTYTINSPDGPTTEEKIVWPTNPSGIAGGCIFVSKRMWDTVGGYRVLGVYSGDDAYLLLDCYQRGFSHQMADTIAIVHPPENDQAYSEWKVRVCQRDSATGVKSNIDFQIKEADSFWESRKKSEP